MVSSKKKSGRPIKGTMKPFLTKEYRDARAVVLGQSESYNDFYKYRTICKNYIVDRWRVSTKFMNRYKVLPITAIEEYLRHSGEDEELIHFFMCLIHYYNHINQCAYFVGEEECLKTVEHQTVIQAAFQDVKKLMIGDVTKVVQKLNNVTTMQQEDLVTIRRQYKLLQETAAIFDNTFKAVFHGELPERITEECFNLVMDFDEKIANFYTKDSISYVVKTNKKKPIYKRLNSDAAFMLSLIETIHDVKRRRL